MSKSVFSAKHFNDEAAAYAYVEARLWAHGRICPHCGVVDRSGELKGKSNRIGLYKCYACRKPFTVKVGTIFEDSHIQMRDWLTAMQLMCSSKKGISSNQLHRTLGITLKSAWFMAHRIREAMGPSANAGPIGGEGQIVEVDETELARSHKTKGAGKRRRADNKKFVTLVARGGLVRSRDISKVRISTTHEVRKVLKEELHPGSVLHSNSAAWYNLPVPAADHEKVNHSVEYVRENEKGEQVHINSAEGYFSIFKRGLVGTYQHMGKQHLQRYLHEFDFRMNHRKKLGFSDEMRADCALKGAVGKRLTYRTVDRPQG